MASQGESLAPIGEQIKDPKRNGGKTLAQIHELMATDSLVRGWLAALIRSSDRRRPVLPPMQESLVRPTVPVSRRRVIL